MSDTAPRLGVILSTTRKTRFADKPAAWLMSKLAQDGRFDAELVDIRDFDLPFFDEAASNLWMPSSDPKAVAWQEKIGSFDAYVFVTAEYNHSISGALKNALDQAYNEWNNKPFSALGYGGSGATRAVEHLRLIGVELQMAPIRNAVHIGGADFFGIHPMGQDAPIEEIEDRLTGSLTGMIDQLYWWTNATRGARAADQA